MGPIQKRLKRLFNRNYRIAKAWRYPRYYLSHRGAAKPIIVYQMGKVGSSSVVAGLEARNYDVFQVHVLTKEWIKRVEAQYEKASRDHNRGIIDEHLLASMFVRGWLDRGFDGKRPQVVTLIRDPVARNMSSFFQTFPIYFSDLAAQFRKADISYDEKIDQLIEIFLTKFEEHDTPINWFDEHFKPVFGVDVYQTSFPHESGYQIYRGENCDVALFRLEDLRRTAPSAMAEFLGDAAFELRDTNLASEKEYSSAYDQFKKGIRLPTSYLDRMYNSRFSKHFYTDQEIAQFRKRWE